MVGGFFFFFFFFLFCLILLLEYFTAGLFLYYSGLFCCANVSAVGNGFGPSHNPCLS